MNKSFQYLTLASCLVLGSTLAYADSDSSHGKSDDKIFMLDDNMLKAMDKDADGKVTEQEYKNHTKKKDLADFNVWDVDASRDIDAWERKIVSQRGGYSEAGGNSGGTAQSDQH